MTDEHQEEQEAPLFTSWQQLADVLMQIGQSMQKRLLLAAEQLTPAVQALHEAAWQAYRNAEMPYGNSHEGLMRWIEDINKIGQLETQIKHCKAPGCDCNHPCDEYLEQQADMLAKAPDPFGVGHTTLD